MARSKASATVHELQMTLLDIEPEIWRRVVVPSSYSLAKLHSVIQILMAWQDYHLYRFTVDGKSYEVPMEELDQELQFRDASKAWLAGLVSGAGANLSYEYDFGDSWQIDIRVVDVRQGGEDERYPVCLDGARSGPPGTLAGYPGTRTRWTPLHTRGGSRAGSCSSGPGRPSIPAVSALRAYLGTLHVPSWILLAWR